MSDQEKFLARWSRRKRDTQDGADAAAPVEPAAASSSESPAGTDDPARESLASQVTRESAEPEFDLASLPPIESIAADSDIRAFLAPGVPPELTRAALRQAWSADPKIRNFVGLAENAWDFTNPDAMPGFGKLEMTEELRKLAVQIVTGARDAAVAEDRTANDPAAARSSGKHVDSRAGHSEEETAKRIASDQEKPVNDTDPSRNCDESPQREPNDIASQQNTEIDKDSQLFTPRSHGRALPE